MSEAPERIKIESECGHANPYNSEDRKTWFLEPDSMPEYFCAEYVRADRIEELELAVRYEADLAQMALDARKELEVKLAKAVRIAEVLSGAVEYDYHGNVADPEERQAIQELAELKG